MRQVKHVRQMRDKAARDGRVYERMGPELGPDELDLARNARQLWADEQALVWAAHQLERWTRRLALERGEEPVPRDRGARRPAQRPGASGRGRFRRRRRDPWGGEPFASGPAGGQAVVRTGSGLAFGLIEVGELERRALALVDAVEEELMHEAAEWWAEMNSGR